MTLPKAKSNGRRHANCAALDCQACEIRPLTFCAGLDNSEIGKLAAIVTRVSLQSQQMLFHEGDSAESVFNLTSGSIKIYKLLPDGRRQITGFLMPGDFLGLAAKSAYSYSAEASTAVEACRFPRSRLDALFGQFPQLEHRLFQIANDELVLAQDQMLLLGRKSAGEKIASFLVRLAERQESRGGEPDHLALTMTRGDIADYLGLTIETVSRTMSQFKKQGLISQKSLTEIELIDRDQMMDRAES